MTEGNKALAYAYFDAVKNGELPDALLTDDMTAWTTTTGSVDKRAYQAMVRMLGRMCAAPLTMTVHSLTAEDDRVVAEAESTAKLINGEDYCNTYIFVFRIRDNRIAAIAEHYNALIVRDRLLPLIKELGTG